MKRKDFLEAVQPVRSVACAVTVTAFCFALIGCQKLSNSVNFDYSPTIHAQDFAKSQIINNGPAAADGSSALLVVIQLMNSDGTPVALFQPTFQIVTGTGVTSSPCTTSNANGVSTCVLKSVTAGTKRIAVTNIFITLQADVVFTIPPAGQSVYGLASAGTTMTSGTYTFQATVGSQQPGIKKTSGTHTFYGSLQGQQFSR